jgi:hypothetical protein
LRKQIAFEPESGFSIEDPLFRYFLINLDTKQVYVELGIESDLVDKGRVYSYDIGFSFSGEVRTLVEQVNAEMKSEDVITFYDFDQQAFLLALDLEQTLARVYTESCRYYLVFIDKHYKEKVWTKFEKDIMTGSGRKNHIIPVIVDDDGLGGLVGISTTIGRVDMRDVWSEMQDSGRANQDFINVIRNRCVNPILQKLDSSEGAV